jgi:biotin synthase-related radical SAM superfamily protein
MHHKGPRNTSTKWGVIHYPKSLWDLKNEINSLHFNDFIVISLCKHRVSIYCGK